MSSEIVIQNLIDYSKDLENKYPEKSAYWHLQKLRNEMERVKILNIPIVNACAPNREFKGILNTYSGFTHSNRNILQIEVSGVENYIGNTLKVGDEVNIQHWR